MKFKFNKDIYDDVLLATEPGSPIDRKYTRVIDEDGNETLSEEEYNLQAIIDSYADECSIERIIELHSLGDSNVLNVKQGVYLDKGQVDNIKLAESNQLELNAQLLTLYQGYKDSMSFNDFANAVKSGNFEALTKKTQTSEVKE